MRDHWDNWLSLALWTVVLFIVVPLAVLSFIGLIETTGPRSLDVLFMFAAVPAILAIHRHYHELTANGGTE